MTTFDKLEQLREHTGQELGLSAWLTITQDMINDFARATGDHQWIHLDAEMARQHSPYGTTVAHGFLTLSLAPRLLAELFRVESVRMGVNYGANKLRFTAAVPAGARVRLRATLLDTEEVPGGLKLRLDCIFELENHPKPACVAELLTVLYE
jgi:acyl dehydratase